MHARVAGKGVGSHIPAHPEVALGAVVLMGQTQDTNPSNAKPLQVQPDGATSVPTALQSSPVPSPGTSGGAGSGPGAQLLGGSVPRPPGTELLICAGRESRAALPIGHRRITSGLSVY